MWSINCDENISLIDDEHEYSLSFGHRESLLMLELSFHLVGSEVTGGDLTSRVEDASLTLSSVLAPISIIYLSFGGVIHAASA